jgi:hypothetical protein
MPQVHIIDISFITTITRPAGRPRKIWDLLEQRIIQLFLEQPPLKDQGSRLKAQDSKAQRLSASEGLRDR